MTTITREQMIGDIRAACIKANPEKVWRIHDDSEIGHMETTIRLADVLAALREVDGDLGIDKDGLFIQPGKPKYLGGYGWEDFAKGKWDTPPVWNLYKDDLTQQSDETIRFIAEKVRPVHTGEDTKL